MPISRITQDILTCMSGFAACIPVDENQISISLYERVCCMLIYMGCINISLHERVCCMLFLGLCAQAMVCCVASLEQSRCS